MNKDAQSLSNLPPGSEPTAGETGQEIPEISVTQIVKKERIKKPIKERIPKIIITDDEQGISIQYAKSPITKKSVEQIIQWIEDRSGIRLSYTVAEPQTHLLISLPGVHFPQGNPKVIEIEQVTPQEAYILVIQQLDKVNLNDLKTIPIKEVEVPGKPVSPPLLGLHEELEKAQAYDKLREMRSRKSGETDDPEKRVRVLQEYLKTNKSMGDLRDMAGVKEADGVNRIVHRNLDKIFSELPLSVQQEYGGSAKEAIKRKAKEQIKTDQSKERVKEGLTTKRWQHYREVEKPQGQPPFSEQGLENIRQRGRNIPRENMSKAARRRWELYRKRQAQNTPAQELPETPAKEERTIIDFTEQSQ